MVFKPHEHLITLGYRFLTTTKNKGQVFKSPVHGGEAVVRLFIEKGPSSHSWAMSVKRVQTNQNPYPVLFMQVQIFPIFSLCRRPLPSI